MQAPAAARTTLILFAAVLLATSAVARPTAGTEAACDPEGPDYGMSPDCIAM
ncbi:hypothetical protein GLOTRDRAFT_110978 [Gloeophyllum trabeum ATCC 11539]|uniref:Uncharacterized protein n=1 Tax=Gloeophyllum trabeum (strain ATCC 11539 / FP-39264 / Madison 617) TaxID=670483 RepID=S7Q6I5_GLOTA|nr:uncharacterized protein GLOTRDRAFT_110978 [Gloeophyllum trabeum ATCC 11539]EPQ55671.1 hypothetical protein GLOTRDRAFT_110978 [Gloeophyllum trabeum ATCC 11539]